MLPDLTSLSFLSKLHWSKKRYSSALTTRAHGKSKFASDQAWWKKAAILHAAFSVTLLAWLLFDTFLPETLPILDDSKSNRLEHAEWHAYVQRVRTVDSNPCDPTRHDTSTKQTHTLTQTACFCF